MWGMMLKDLLCLRKGFGVYLLATVVYGGLCLAGVWDATFFSWFFTLMVVMLPVNCFGMDAAARWDAYACTLPVGRRKLVAARYLLLLMMTGVGLAAALAVGGALAATGRIEDWGSYVVMCCASAALGLLINGVMLPLLYRFGAERARVAFIAVLGLVVLAGVGLYNTPMGAIAARELSAPGSTLATLLPPALCGAGICVALISYTVSCAIESRKEY